MKGILAIAFALTLALGYLALHAQNNQKLETNFAAANSADSELASLDPGAAAPSENSAPELAKVTKGPVVSNLTRSSASIAWITDGDAATEVRYSSDGKHWRTAFKPGDEREHVVN